MQLSVQTVIQYLETLAPKHLAFEWDHVGLQVGSLHGTVNKIMVTLDVNACVLNEANEMGVDFIVTHHPFIFRPVSAVRTDLPLGSLIERALKSNIRIYAAHTNLDVAAGGVNDALAAHLGLHDTDILRLSGREELEKIAVFVPLGHEDNVRDALASAGAGWIGNYSHCTFQSAGTGTFIPREGTNPYIGSQGKLERVKEVRLETIYPAHLRNRIVKAMVKAHPYEEAAYDIYPLGNEGKPYGLGRVGKISAPCTLQDFCAFVKEKLLVDSLRVTGDLKKIINKVAVCGGSGGDLIHAASFAGADVLVTGDLKYHEACDCSSLGMALIDAGHDATERVIVPVLTNYLKTKLAENGYNTPVEPSALETAPWNVV
ncbi:MAG: Nif3-like dinuclear metal center hexameric protein [Bacillota bacterium]|nr:Nif3-like dinuclear metal center hexameric protein [Bacillota bacterium]MDW7684939.1 Nif3-like dinuclear metal center hexameric protein [Bacillota bacterium]